MPATRGSWRRCTAIPEVISADWVTGEIDAILVVVARDVAEVQRVIMRLSSRGGAVRVTTLLTARAAEAALPAPALGTVES